jgi:hypothetical protein
MRKAITCAPDTNGLGCAAIGSKCAGFAYFDPNDGAARLPVAMSICAWLDGEPGIPGDTAQHPTIHCDTLSCRCVAAPDATESGGRSARQHPVIA